MASYDISKSFYGELSLASDDSKVNFSYVTHTTTSSIKNPLSGGAETPDDSGYNLEFFEYMTVNTFEHYAENFYFQYSSSANAYALMMSDQGTKWVGITNNGYAWKTSDSTRCNYFRFVGEDKTTRLDLSNITGDTAKIYLVLTPPGTILCTYSKTTAKEHSWSYLTAPGDTAALFNLKILERGATWPKS